MKNLGKVKNFRAVTMINCKKQLPNLGEDLFFLENNLLLGRKLKKKERLNLSEDLFFLKITMILGQNLFLVRESQTIFLSYS